MKIILCVTWMTALSYGLWTHDWTTIVMAVTLALVWPMIADDLHKQRRERLLERLWDDDRDLSESA